jgi:hypothetical protein
MNSNALMEVNSNTKSTITHQLTMNYLQKDLSINEIKIQFDGSQVWPEGMGGLSIGQMLVSCLSNIVNDPEFIGYKAQLHRIEGNKLVADYQPYIK